MSSAGAMPSRGRRRVIWLAAIAGLLLVVAANAHLVYVAVTSEPACVAHRQPGASVTEGRAYSAAQSDCAPRAPRQDGRG
jgi:hypothetical protein